MKRMISVVLLLVVFLGITAEAVKISIDQVTAYAQDENSRTTALVQQRVDETLKLQEDLSNDQYIRSPKVSFEEKAQYLTDKNNKEELGYMMLRILDSEINIYKEGLGLASSLASREYMQVAYTTGIPQVTDAFLAGADGTTINYTVVTPVLEDGEVISAIMAAIYGTEIDGDLQSEDAVNVLVGSQLQYMGGVPQDQFGLPVAEVLETETRTSRPVENILLDFYDEKSGSFWGLRGGVQFYTYSPVEACDWVVMTEVNALPLIRYHLVIYGVCVVALIVVGVLLCRRKRPKVESK